MTSADSDHTAPSTTATLAAGRERLARARRQRHQALADVALGHLTPHDVVVAAAQPHGRPLLRIGIRPLLGSQPGWGNRTVNRFLDHLSGICPLPNRDIQIRWILDPRSGGRRFLAWLDTWRPQRPPWPDFPYTPPPAAGSEDPADMFARTGLHPNLPPR